ncbi:MAG: glycosyltransferase family 4 protein [Planctomycetes bacterium]|nr:glycosyltransferase family 4 protein [Planctomycetota bacterium]
MQRLKIALVFPKYTTHGGTERFIYDFSQKLLEMGHEVHLVVGKISVPVDKRIVVHKASVIRCGRFIKIVSFLLSSRWILKKHRFDIVQGFGRTIKHDVFRAGGGCHKEYRNNVLRKIKNPVARYFKLYLPYQILLLYIEKRQFFRGNFKKIVAISNQVKKELVSNYRVPAKDIEVIYSGVDIDVFNPANRGKYLPVIRKPFDIKRHEKVILFLGTGFERKGLIFLMRAFATLSAACPDTKLLVVGKDNAIKRYMQHAEQLQIADRVIFTGQQSDVEMFYAAADVFVLPTLYEPFGSVCLEALASGLPVITSRVAGASEVLDGMEHLVVEDPMDIEEMAGKIRLLLADDAERAKLAIAARKIAERYTISHNAQRFVSLYRDIIEHRV